jgi:hypothetical protein
MPNDLKDAPYSLAKDAQAKEKTSITVEPGGTYSAPKPAKAKQSWPPKEADENTYDKIVTAPRQPKQHEWESKT